MEGDVGKFIYRRLHPVRVTVNLLNQQLELAKAGKDVTIDRNLYQSIVSTFELFLEDFDERVAIAGASDRSEKSDKKFVESSKSTIKI